MLSRFVFASLPGIGHDVGHPGVIDGSGRCLLATRDAVTLHGDADGNAAGVFRIVPGLAWPGLAGEGGSFVSPDEAVFDLRHAGFVLRLDHIDGSALARYSESGWRSLDSIPADHARRFRAFDYGQFSPAARTRKT